MDPRAAPGTHAGLTLPATWDPGRDVLVWIGPRGPEVPEGARVFVVESAAPRSELFAALLGMAGVAPKHALVHRSPSVPAEGHREIAETVKSALRARAIQQKTLATTGPTWLLQGLANLPALAAHPSIAALKGACAGVPCVLVSPGPSLSRNIGLLRELSERALILSGTHALTALARAGVAPHLVVCADPGDLARHWEGVDLAGVEAFVIGATCHADTWAAPARRRFTFAGNGPLDSWLYEALGAHEPGGLPGLPTGGSVACSMLSLALHLGCDPIAFVGQDLSFTDRFYAAEGLDGDAMVAPAGTAPLDGNGAEFVLVKPAGATGIGTPLPDGRLQFTVPQQVLTVPGWDGGTVRTTPQLKLFLDWFESVVPALRGATRVLNCSEGGARIGGMEHVSLGAASAGWSRAPALAPILDRAQASLDVAARRGALRDWARGTLQALETCVDLARRCRKELGRAVPDVDALGRLERKLARSLRAAPLVSLVAQDEIVQAREDARLARSLAQNLAAARALYGVVARAGELLTEPLRATRRALDDER